MGMFDTVNVPCPTCQTTSGFQSKSGDCSLAEYAFDEAPGDVMMDVNRHAPATCTKCGTKFGVKLTISAEVIVWPEPGKTRTVDVD